jgi:hypothetical protein
MPRSEKWPKKVTGWFAWEGPSGPGWAAVLGEAGIGTPR